MPKRGKPRKGVDLTNRPTTRSQSTESLPLIVIGLWLRNFIRLSALMAQNESNFPARIDELGRKLMSIWVKDLRMLQHKPAGSRLLRMLPKLLRVLLTEQHHRLLPRHLKWQRPPRTTITEGLTREVFYSVEKRLAHKEGTRRGKEGVSTEF